jgi:hypothetical protein
MASGAGEEGEKIAIDYAREKNRLAVTNVLASAA